jgi:predicted RNA binding protein YcfA (HicA-like mRNA interferase family)
LTRKVPSENYDRIIVPLKRLGFSIIRQRGSHIRLQRQLPHKQIKIIVPAHRPVKRSTLSHILKKAEVSLEDFLAAL